MASKGSQRWDFVAHHGIGVNVGEFQLQASSFKGWKFFSVTFEVIWVPVLVGVSVPGFGHSVPLWYSQWRINQGFSALERNFSI